MEDVHELLNKLRKGEKEKVMEKREITALDLRFLAKEFREKLNGGLIQKIYQYGTGVKQFIFDIYIPQARSYILYFDNNKIFITKNKEPAPQEPPDFCMFLRKHLMGKRIRNIRQHDFDRIVEIQTDENILIIELFSPGNVILCDSSYKIIMPLEMQKWRDREIKPKNPYRYPPRVSDPFAIEFGEIMMMLRKSEKNIVAFLATDLGLGGLYASEICFRGGIEGSRPANEMSLHEASSLHKVIESMDKIPFQPSVYRETVSPFALTTYKEKPQEYQSLSDAFDDFFKEQMLEVKKEEETKKEQEVKEKVKRIEAQQEKAIEKWATRMEGAKTEADLIYRNYSIVQGVLEGIRRAKDMGLPWTKIKERIKMEETPEAGAIKEIRESEGIVVIEIEGREIELDIRKSVEENAAIYYEDAKKAKKKLAATEVAVEQLKQKELQLPKKEEKKPVVEEKEEWFEKFKWFISSEGFLVIGGRNAEQNEFILKRHTENNDLVFHADIPGAAFVVIKSNGKTIGEQTKKEAAEFAAANSKAWSKGLGTVDIYSVPAAQVTKSPPSGEFLPKGSFFISGSRAWYRDMELKLSVGIKVDKAGQRAKVISGPVMAARKNSDYFVTIKPGFRKSLELARAIKNKILIKARPEDKYLIEKVSLDDIEKVIPSDSGEIVEYGS